MYTILGETKIWMLGRIILGQKCFGARGSTVERQSLASVFSPSCARPVADG